MQVDYILGYSFGGAVAVKYSLLYDKNQKIILVSPAITRDKGKSKNMIKTPKFMRPIREIVILVGKMLELHWIEEVYV